MNNFKRLWHHLSKHHTKQLALLLLLMIIATISEVVSLGAVLPFLGVLTAPEQIFQHVYVQPLVSALMLSEPKQLILPITILFIIAALLAGIIRLLLLYVMTRLSFAIGADLSINIYRRTLYQPYATHAARNSSEVINSVITKTNTVINHILAPILMLISSTLIFVAIVAVLSAINISVALLASVGFGLLYWLFIRYTKNHLKDNGQIIADQSTQMLKLLQEGWEEFETC